MDAALKDRQEFIARTWHHSSLEAKRARAIKSLGDKWVMHKKWAVKRKDLLAKEQT